MLDETDSNIVGAHNWLTCDNSKRKVFGALVMGLSRQAIYSALLTYNSNNPVESHKLNLGRVICTQTSLPREVERLLPKDLTPKII